VNFWANFRTIPKPELSAFFWVGPREIHSHVAEFPTSEKCFAKIKFAPVGPVGHAGIQAGLFSINNTGRFSMAFSKLEKIHHSDKSTEMEGE